MINWADLNQKTATYNSLVKNTDPVSGLIDVTFCGLQAKMSDILKDVDTSKLHSVAVFCDTLIFDVATVAGSGLVVSARSVDISALKNNPLILQLTAGSGGVAQFMISNITGGTFSIIGTDKSATKFSPPVGLSPLQATIYTQSTQGVVSVLSAGNNISNVQQLVQMSWSLNSYMASYTAAAWLMDNNADDEKVAQSMLSWITANIASLAQNGATMSSDYAELYNQSAGLLVLLNVSSGTLFVPILSSDIYSSKLTQLIDLLGDYENDMSTLETQKDIAQAVATVSAGLKNTASIETQPLELQLSNVQTNMASLQDDIRELTGDFYRQKTTTDTSYNVMQTYITLDEIKEQLKAELEMVMAGVEVSFDAMKVFEGDVKELGALINHSIEGLEKTIDVIKGFSTGGGGDQSSLGSNAINLLQDQQSIMSSFLTGSTLSANAQQGQTGQGQNINPASVTVDPVTSWNNYVFSAQAQLASIQREGGDVGSAADTVVANIQILAGYGKAIGSKYAAYISQLVQQGVLISQINAAKDVEKNWENIEKNATSDEQKLTALKAVVQSRANGIKRSVFLSWNYYAAAYYYLNFQTPTPEIHIDMSSTAMKSALVGVSDWVDAALGNTGAGGTHVTLPSTNAEVTLQYNILQSNILQSNQAPASTDNVAQLVKNTDGSFDLMWNLPVGSAQLKGVLPNKGNCAIWITEAEFFLDGVTPNAKGNIISTVATSGTYENGFGTANNHTFVTKGLSGNYLYTVAGSKVYSPWQIDTSVYMTPTPYTQWTMNVPSDGGDLTTAKTLTVKLKISYTTQVQQSAFLKAGGM